MRLPFRHVTIFVACTFRSKKKVNKLQMLKEYCVDNILRSNPPAWRDIIYLNTF